MTDGCSGLRCAFERAAYAGSPVGFIPGEAGVFLVLETERGARARGVTPLGRLRSIGLDREEVPLGGALVSRGDGLTRAVRACLAGAGGGKDIERVITDINGERWRSTEYSVVATRCLTALPRGFIHWHPADCVGDTGAASGALAIGMAVRGLARGYAGRGGVLIHRHHVQQWCLTGQHASDARGAAAVAGVAVAGGGHEAGPEGTQGQQARVRPGHRVLWR